MVSPISSITHIQSAIPKIIEQIPYLKLLILFGSRARGDNFPSSDWDFALLFDEELRQQYEPDGGWNYYQSWGVLQRILDLGDGEIDWIDLKNASKLLAHEIARDGVAIYESESGIFEKFKENALKSETELKAYRNSVREKVHAALKRWNV